MVVASIERRFRLFPVVSMAAIPWERMDEDDDDGAEGVPNVSRRLVALSVPFSATGAEVQGRIVSEGKCESPKVGFISSNHPAMMHRKVISCRLASGVSRLAGGMRDCGVDRVVKLRPEMGMLCCGNEVVVVFVA